jgi:hypothetical protein
LKIYVASSWRNLHQPAVVLSLREAGHDVYDFRHPAEGDAGFSWREIDPDWRAWTVDQHAKALEHPIAVAGHASDMRALVEADLCVLVLPSGRSASWEYGFHAGMTGILGVVHSPEPCEPELMYAGSLFTSTLGALVDAVAQKSSEVVKYGNGDVMRELHLQKIIRRLARVKRLQDFKEIKEKGDGDS